jgi:CheY-like chemotaxis protein
MSKGATAARRPVLVVDDDPSVRAMLTDILELKGFTVVTAEHGAAALDILAHTPVGLILLDLMMPIMDGRTFVTRLKDLAITIPIVALSAETEAHHWAHEIGAVGFVAKPFHVADVMSIATKVYAHPIP